MCCDVIESVHLKRAETKFRLLFLMCETLQFSMVMTNINTKRTHSTCSDMRAGGGGGGVRGRWDKAMFFQLLSTKLKLVDKIMQSTYLCVILQIRHKKNQFSGILPDC